MSRTNRKRKREPEPCQNERLCDCEGVFKDKKHSHMPTPEPVCGHVSDDDILAHVKSQFDTQSEDGLNARILEFRTMMQRSSKARMHLDVSFFEVPFCFLRACFPFGIPYNGQLKVQTTTLHGRNQMADIVSSWPRLLCDDVIFMWYDTHGCRVDGDAIQFTAASGTTCATSVNSITRVEVDVFHDLPEYLLSLRALRQLVLHNYLYVSNMDSLVLPCLKTLTICVNGSTVSNVVSIINRHALQHITLYISLLTPNVTTMLSSQLLRCLSTIPVVNIRCDPRIFDDSHNTLTLLLSNLHNVQALRVYFEHQIVMTHEIYKLLSTHPTLTTATLSVRWTAEFPVHGPVARLLLLPHVTDDKNHVSQQHGAHNERVFINRKYWSAVCVLISFIGANYESKISTSVFDLVPSMLSLAGFDSLDEYVLPFNEEIF